MKRMIYLLILGGTLLLAGCHEVTIGYLLTEDAGYQIDTMEIYSITGRLEKINQQLDYFYRQYPDMQNERLRLKKEVKERKQEADEFERIKLNPLYDEQDKLYEEDPVKNADRIAELDELIWMADEEYWEIRGLAEEAEFMLAELDDEIMAMGEETSGLSDAPGVLEKMAAELQDRIDSDIPFTTSPIESVEGTEPLRYEVESVKAATPEAAEQFRKYTGVMGGGRIYVRQDVDAPAGNYTLSLRITNEGHSKVIADAFTFVLVE